jgi:uncharacterized protein (DUF1800 family)
MLTPLNPKQWDITKAAHLLNRAGFGGTPAQIEALFQAGFDGAVEAVLNGPDDSQQFPKPANLSPVNFMEMREQYRMLPEQERREKFKEMQKAQRGDMLELVTWWLNRMAQTPFPLREKLTLFWHGHFATSVQKVKMSYLMWQQNETLRQNALGNFGSMVKAISRDPAMMIYLDTRESKRDHPNENFARELMELFTLGIGNYTEDDIQQSARAFTGYRINPQDDSFRFAQFQHDDGQKTFFGQTGHFGGDDIINLILQKPACARFITHKIWTFFAYENPSQALVEAISGSFRESGYDIKSLMREIFRSNEFYSARTIRMQIKSPVQWIVQTSKILETDPPAGIMAVNALRQLGQMPFAPPNVKGWDGGKAWITTSTLLSRYNLANFALNNGRLNVQPAQRIAGGNNAMNRPGFDMENRKPVDFAKIAPPELRSDPEKLVANLAFRLFQTPLTERDRKPFLDFVKEKNNDTSDQVLRELLHLMMSTPQYQLT